MNCDGKRDIVDITSLIDYLLGNNPSPFNLQAADVDEDASVSITDITRLIDMILNE